MADQPNNVFGEDTNTNGNPPQPAESGNLEDLLKNIKNDNGEPKYKSLEDALVALDHSQKYIPELKSQLTGTQQELAEMKGKLEKLSAVEDTVQRLLAQQQTPPATTAEKSGLDEQAVRKLVLDSLQQSEKIKQLSANQQKVNDALVGKFGEKAIEVLDRKAAELKTTRQALGDLASQNPDLVLALFESPASKEPNPTVSARRTPDPKHVDEGLRKPDKSLLSGVSLKDQAARLVEIRKHKHSTYGISE